MSSQLLTLLDTVALESREIENWDVVKITLNDVLLDVNVTEPGLENLGHGGDVDAP